MDFGKRNETFLETVVKANEKITVEGDTIVPDIKPDVLKVLQVDANSVITNKEITQNGIVVEGKLLVSVLYLPDSKSESTGCISTSFDFRERFDVDGITDDMRLKLKSNVTKVDFHLINSRKLSIKANVRINYEVVGKKEIEIIDSVNDGGCESKMEEIMHDRIAFDEECEFIVRDNIEISQGKNDIAQIMKKDAKILSREIKAVSGKLILKGILQVNILYLDSENNLDFAEGEFPFTEVFDVYDLKEDDNLILDLDICDLSADMTTDNDGDMRVLNFEALLNAQLTGKRQCKLKMMSDCYIPHYNANITGKKLPIKCYICKKEDIKTIKELITPDEKSAPIVRIYNVLPEVEVTKCEVKNGMVNVFAKLLIYIMYLSDEENRTLYTLKHEMDINYSTSCEKADDNMCADAKVFADRISYNLNSMGSVEVRCIVNYNIYVSKTECLNIISDIEPENECDGSEIIIYFVKQGDSLWSIGKQFKVKIDDIMKINALSDDKIYPGQKLVIPL